LSLDREGWKKEVDDIEKFLSQFNARLPVELMKEVANLKNQLSA
jgi:GTP-dependent phosphoenolpyruvate carboxykinase